MTQDFVHHLAEGTIATFRPHLADDFTYIGPRDGEWLVDREALTGHPQVVQAGERADLTIGDEDLHVLSAEDSTCVIVYRFTLSRGEQSVRLRLTAFWDQTGHDDLRAVHCHLSRAVMSADDMPGQAGGAETHGSRPRASIVLRDADGVSHFLAIGDVVYIEANRQSTYVHCTNGQQFRVSEGISRLQERLDGAFVRIHRGFAVNALHVAGMRTGCVIMDDGSSLPVPTRRANAVRSELQRVRAEHQR